MTALTPLKKYRAKVIFAPFMKLVECVAELATPFLVRYVIDDGIAERRMDVILLFGGIILALALVGFGSTMVAQYLASRVAADYGHDLRSALFERTLALGERDLDTFSKAKISTLIGNDAFAMQNGVMMFIRLIFRPPFLIFGSLILSFVVSPWAGLIFTGATLLSAAIMGIVMALSPRRYRDIQSSLDRLSTVSGDDIRGRRQIKAFNNQEKEKKRYYEATKGYERNSMRMGTLNSIINPFTFLFIDLGIVLVVCLGVPESGIAGLSQGSIASLISYLVSSLAALTMWSRLITSLNKARESRRRLDAYFAIPIPEKGELVSPLVFNEGTPIAFEDVSYAYGAKDGGRAVSHLSFELPYGKGIGLVGGTGSGKSTCLKLLSGLFAPSEGRIVLGDRVVSENGQKKLDLRSFFTYVPQKITLFRGTVRDNLRLAKPEASDEEMLLALEKAQALAFLQEKGNPLEVAIKEGGSNLSGGQKQRLALARAFLSPAPILLLDDSLSALDYLTEKKIRDELPTLFPTRFLISSRLSLVEGMDEILFFEHGEIVARGTHEQLLATCPSYKELADIQKGEVA